MPRLTSRFLFVVGKGGVGKTTAAGALAVALADAGERTCLISTDPAHSVGDFFGVTLAPGEVRPSPCSERLLLEELDADGYARRWMERARAPILELFDRGTYLDAEDVERFLDLTLPGVDEVAGVLRLGELAASDFQRIVVDTAPTGHTLRLLGAGAVVRSWAEAFDAMAEKAGAVIGQLTRTAVRLAGEEIARELQERVALFQERVLASGQAVLIERDGAVVEAETERLARALVERGLPVAVRVRVASEPEPDAEGGRGSAVVRIPFNDGLQGCEGARSWGTPRAGPGEPAATRPAGGVAELLAGFPPLLLFAGKGGVGKSTCAAAAAVALAERFDVVLLGTDPAGSLADVLDVPMPEGEARPLPRLTVRQVRAEAEFEALTRRYHESVARAFHALGLESAAALDRRVVDSLLGLAPPGIDEVFSVAALIGDSGALAAGRRIVVDTAPTGHFLRLLATPEVALAWTRELLRVLHRYRAVLGLDAFAERLLDFAKQLRELHLTLVDPERSAAIVVTQPGPLVTAESLRLLDGLSRARVRVAAVVANRTPAAVPLPTAPRGAATLRAPSLPEPPVGADALRRFLERWTVDAAG